MKLLNYIWWHLGFNNIGRFLHLFNMSRQKKIFVILAVVFLALLFYASYDIGSRTTFPGSKPQLKERLEKQFLKRDSAKTDTLSATHR
jgi:hypothetical protein